LVWRASCNSFSVIIVADVVYNVVMLHLESMKHAHFEWPTMANTKIHSHSKDINISMSLLPLLGPAWFLSFANLDGGGWLPLRFRGWNDAVLLQLAVGLKEKY
jgi:hypothetical protein